jgi:hypothetical protein
MTRSGLILNNTSLVSLDIFLKSDRYLFFFSLVFPKEGNSCLIWHPDFLNEIDEARHSVEFKWCLGRRASTQGNQRDQTQNMSQTTKCLRVKIGKHVTRTTYFHLKSVASFSTSFSPMEAAVSSSSIRSPLYNHLKTSLSLYHDHIFRLPQQEYQRVQLRFFDSRKVQRRKKGIKPFKVLSMPPGSLYKDVKRKFLKIAMTNHPDTHAEDLTNEEREKMRNIFIQARVAFELLTEDDDGTAILISEKVDSEDAMNNFDSWFKSETGLHTPFQFDMDPETMKEVAKMTETVGGDSGLDRDGGMWALARMVTSAVKAGGDAATILRIESGDIKGQNRSNGELRRRRKR